MKSWIKMLFAICAAGCAIGCGDRSPKQPSHRTEKHVDDALEVLTFRHDFGDVQLSQGARDISHRFRVENETDAPIEISAIKTSCGCATADLDARVINPHDAATLTLTVKISAAGRTAQGATLVRSDGQLRSYVLEARGLYLNELRVFPTQTRLRLGTRYAEVRLYQINADPMMETLPPHIIGSTNVTMYSRDWAQLEKGSKETSRASRYVGTFVLDFANYTGEFPATIRMHGSGDVECSFVVDGPELR